MLRRLRRLRFSRVLIGILLVLVILCLYGRYIESRWIDVTTTTIRLQHLPMHSMG